MDLSFGRTAEIDQEWTVDINNQFQSKRDMQTVDNMKNGTGKFEIGLVQIFSIIIQTVSNAHRYFMQNR